ncbi:hypothetical protein JTB14_008420 [Gonioctena quinquepunctata]|nr:hypothetical protein JTB14_008420 [Gonioctena quinquepunctata]
MAYMDERKLKHTKIVIIEDLIRSRYETLLLAKQKIEMIALGLDSFSSSITLIDDNILNSKLILKYRRNIHFQVSLTTLWDTKNTQLGQFRFLFQIFDS